MVCPQTHPFYAGSSWGPMASCFLSFSLPSRSSTIYFCRSHALSRSPLLHLSLSLLSPFLSLAQSLASPFSPSPSLPHLSFSANYLALMVYIRVVDNIRVVYWDRVDCTYTVHPIIVAQWAYVYRLPSSSLSTIHENPWPLSFLNEFWFLLIRWFELVAKTILYKYRRSFQIYLSLFGKLSNDFHSRNRTFTQNSQEIPLLCSTVEE